MPNDIICERENTWTAHINKNQHAAKCFRDSLLSNFSFQKFSHIWFTQGVVDV